MSRRPAAPPPEGAAAADRIRLDRWLCHARVFKTRTLAADTLVLAPRSGAERQDEARRLADAFARTLARYKGGTDGAASDVRWRFDRIQQAYVLDLVSAWRDTLGAPQRLAGRLTVRESGLDARFDGRAAGDSSAPVLTYRFDRLAGLTTPSKTKVQN